MPETFALPPRPPVWQTARGCARHPGRPVVLVTKDELAYEIAGASGRRASAASISSALSSGSSSVPAR
jgi:hypothetical protein